MVITAPYPRVIVPAAAGSGKTATLGARIRHRLDRGVLAEEILVLSFSNKAVNTLKERIDNDDIRIMTFHAFAGEAVRAHAAQQGLRAPLFVNTGTSDALLKTAIDACPKACDFVRQKIGIRLRSSIERKKLALFFSRVQSNDEIALRLANDPGSVFSVYWPVRGALRAIRIRYERELDHSGRIDYAGMLRRGCGLLRGGEMRLPYRHLLIDEAQDLTAEQAQLLAAIATQVPHVMAFGDPHQAIFGFMGAGFRHLREALPGAKMLSLSHSFRLTHETAATANAIVNDRERPVIGDRSGRKPSLFRLPSAVAQERAVIHRVGYWMEQRASGESIAILAPTRMQLRSMEHALRVAGYATAPTYRERLPEHLDRFLCLLKFVEKWKSAFTAEVRARNHWIEQHICAIVGIAETVFAHGVLAHCRRRLGIAARASTLASRYVTVSRVYIKLMSAAHGRDSNVACELERWEAISRRFEKADQLRAHIDTLEAQPKIVTSTIHGAKSDEWDCVIVLNVTDGALPLHHAIRAGTIDEERRLLYVAVTRARKQLYLFHAPYRHTWTGEVFAEPSRFLTEEVIATLT